jgi:hypothetical protein
VKLAAAYLGLSGAFRLVGLFAEAPALARLAATGQNTLLGARIVPPVLAFVALFFVMDRRPFGHLVGLLGLLVTWASGAVPGVLALARQQGTSGAREAELLGFGMGLVLHALLFASLWLTFAFSAGTRAYFRAGPRDGAGGAPPRA